MAIRFGVKVCNNFIFHQYLLLLNYIALKLLQPLQDLVHFLHFWFCLLIFFVVSNNFIVSGVCNSNLYPFFYFKHQSIVNSIDVNMNRRNCCWCFVFFLWYIQFNLEYLTLNKNHLAIQIHHSTLDLLFLVHNFYTVFLYFFYL